MRNAADGSAMLMPRTKSGIRACCRRLEKRRSFLRLRPNASDADLSASLRSKTCHERFWIEVKRARSAVFEDSPLAFNTGMSKLPRFKIIVAKIIGRVRMLGAVTEVGDESLRVVRQGDP